MNINLSFPNLFLVFSRLFPNVFLIFPLTLLLSFHLRCWKTRTFHNFCLLFIHTPYIRYSILYTLCFGLCSYTLHSFLILYISFFALDFVLIPYTSFLYLIFLSKAGLFFDISLSSHIDPRSGDRFGFFRPFVQDSRRSDRFLGTVTRNLRKTKTSSARRATRLASSARVSSATAICKRIRRRVNALARDVSSRRLKFFRSRVPASFRVYGRRGGGGEERATGREGQRFNSIRGVSQSQRITFEILNGATLEENVRK